jgi:hypothetical protein
MTNKEAIETIKIAIAEVEWNFPMDYAVAFETAIEALTEAEQYKLALFAAIRNSTVMPSGVKLGKNMHEINKMSVETMHEVLKMCDFEKLRESYKDGEEE